MPTKSTAPWLLPGIALLAGILGMTAIWVAIATLTGSPCSWLGLVAAIDMALLLRLTGAPAGLLRTGVALLGTATIVALSQWMIVATQLGIVLGLQPVASALRLGPVLAWQLGSLNLTRVDWVLLAASLLLGAILSDRRPRP